MNFSLEIGKPLLVLCYTILPFLRLSLLCLCFPWSSTKTEIYKRFCFPKNKILTFFILSFSPPSEAGPDDEGFLRFDITSFTLVFAFPSLLFFSVFPSVISIHSHTQSMIIPQRCNLTMVITLCILYYTFLATACLANILRLHTNSGSSLECSTLNVKY